MRHDVAAAVEHAGIGSETGSRVIRLDGNPEGTNPEKTGSVYWKLMSLGKEPPVQSVSNVSVRRVHIGEEDAGQRIDNFLMRECKGVPKSHIYRILRSGEVRVNGGRIAQTYRLVVGDEVRIPPVRVAERNSAPAPAAVVRTEFPVVFEDDALLVINKPAGVAVHGGSGVSFGVIELLRQQRSDARFLELVHRLDRETSGLLIIAKRRVALNGVQDAMRHGQIEKRYLAMAPGRWMNPLQHIRLALHKYLTADGERRVSVDREGKPAHSIVRLVKRWERFSLVEVELKTGRTHQIRVHMQAQGFPLLGDDKYGDFPLNKELVKAGLSRMFLHAARLCFNHPLTGQRLELSAPLPDELTRFVERVESTQTRDYG
jgi:23S rRNA pseudouridine955/2504/2580 synthase